MTHKRRGQLTVSPERHRHLRPALRRAFWKRERQAVRLELADETANVQAHTNPGPAQEHEVDNAADIGARED
jgi:hypothetical protein